MQITYHSHQDLFLNRNFNSEFQIILHVLVDIDWTWLLGNEKKKMKEKEKAKREDKKNEKITNKEKDKDTEDSVPQTFQGPKGRQCWGDSSTSSQYAGSSPSRRMLHVARMVYGIFIPLAVVLYFGCIFFLVYRSW